MNECGWMEKWMNECLFINQHTATVVRYCRDRGDNQEWNHHSYPSSTESRVHSISQYESIFPKGAIGHHC